MMFCLTTGPETMESVDYGVSFLLLNGFSQVFVTATTTTKTLTNKVANISFFDL
jgi:hypothetical protein